MPEGNGSEVFGVFRAAQDAQCAVEAEGFEGISIADELRAEREGHEGEVYQNAEARAVGTADIKEWEAAAGKESREVGGGGFGEI